MTNVWRVPVVSGSVARLAYFVGAMFAPEWMGGRLAPRLDGHAGARMNLRGMAGAHIGVALYTLASARSAQSARSALSVNMLVDGITLAGSSVLERRDRGKVDALVAGDLAVNGAFLLCWTAAAASLRKH